MPVPTQLSDLNVTAASNSPAATDTLSTTDDYIRALSSILARISAGTDKLATPGTTGAMDVAGNFSVATSKFTVAAASGNTVVAGTLGVSGLVQMGTANGSGQLNVQHATAGRTLANLQGVAAQMFIDNTGSGDTFLDQASLQIRTYAGAAIATFTSTGLSIASLAGSGTRHVVVDANGVLSAP